jgi:two-component system, chemotaxis family, response regulator PixG
LLEGYTPVNTTEMVAIGTVLTNVHTFAQMFPDCCMASLESKRTDFEQKEQLMSHPELMVSNNLLGEFNTCTRLQYSGKLNIKSSKGHQWIFYYRLGRMVWATGGTHPFRRWRRHMAQYCPDIDMDKIQLRAEEVSIDYWDYRLLEIFYEKQKLKREQINGIVEHTIAELLFDLAQQANFASLSCDRTQDAILEAPMSFTSADMSLKLMQDSWKNWSEAGLASFSPDLAPMLRRPEQLQQQVSPSVYKNFLTLMNGKYTLRDLAVKMKQSILPVARSLLPYILKGILELVEVNDSPLRIAESTKKSSSTKTTAPLGPLIACVDDSPQVCQMLEQIMIPNGFRFIKIPDAVQALPILIEHKPDLIFLDLVMPVASGYEICAQLRRISLFANTPVIILTGSDGLLDRVRAKVVGSTDFISKPVAVDKVMAVVRKYVQAPSAPSSASNVQTLSLGHQ